MESMSGPDQAEMEEQSELEPAGPERAAKAPVWARIVRGTGVVALVVFVLGALATATAVVFLPAAASGTTMKVLSGSMEGTFSEGDVVVAKPIDADDIEPGDVITFTAYNSNSTKTNTVTHRVVEVLSGAEGPEFVTKGDANNINDQGTTKAEDVKGEYWYHVPYAGKIRDSMFEPIGLFYGAAILMLLVGVHLLVPRNQSTGPEPSASEHATDDALVEAEKP